MIPSDVFWGNAGALMVDVDGDGVTDLVGRATDSFDGPRHAIVALDGATGRLLWRTRTPAPDIVPIVALWDGIVLGMQAEHGVVGLDVKTGAQRWSVTLPVSIQRFCEKGGKLFVRTGARKEAFLDATTGTLATEIGETNEECGRVIHDQEHGDPNTQPWGSTAFVEVWDPVMDWVVPGSASRVHLSIDTESYVERRTDARRDWRSPLVIPEGYEAEFPSVFATGDDTACVSITIRGPTYRRRLTCVDLATGNVRWATTLEDLDRVYISDRRLYIVDANRVASHDVHSGALVWVVGCATGTTLIGCTVD